MGTILGNRNVHFIYDERTIEIPSNGETIEKTQKRTTCVITRPLAPADADGNEMVEVSRAAVHLHHKDRDNKLVARYYALRDATAELGRDVKKPRTI